MYYTIDNSSPVCSIYRDQTGKIIKIVLHKDAVKHLPILIGELNSHVKLE